MRSKLAIVGVLLASGLVAGWFAYSPYRALGQLSDFDIDQQAFSALYDPEALRKAFAAQTVPEMDGLPPPITKNVVLDALVAPEAVRLLVAEPYGEWQFAAAEGLPEEIKKQLDADQEPQPYMPRMLEMTESWTIDRQGLDTFVAMPADREGGHSYTFERAGLGWRLVHIQLSEPIR